MALPFTHDQRNPMTNGDGKLGGLRPSQVQDVDFRFLLPGAIDGRLGHSHPPKKKYSTRSIGGSLGFLGQ